MHYCNFIFVSLTERRNRWQGFVLGQGYRARDYLLDFESWNKHCHCLLENGHAALLEFNPFRKSYQFGGSITFIKFHGYGRGYGNFIATDTCLFEKARSKAKEYLVP